MFILIGRGCSNRFLHSYMINCTDTTAIIKILMVISSMVIEDPASLLLCLIISSPCSSCRYYVVFTVTSRFKLYDLQLIIEFEITCLRTVGS
jgi:hypothetical protein